MAVEEILPNLFKMEIPLPQSPLKALNSYLIKSEGRFLIVDTGWNHHECMREMLSNLERLNVDLRKTDFLITHLHVDHLGLVANLATNTSIVYFNQKEARIVNYSGAKKKTFWQKLYAVHLSNGFPEEELKKSMESHPGRKYGLHGRLAFRILKESDMIQVGDYLFRCIETPGHSPGHMCLYEANRKILVSGDHILFDITPNITFWLEMEDSLKEYLASLEKVHALDIDLVLPGHRSIFPNHKKRIKELKEHHQARLKEVTSALENGDKTAFEIASHLTWNIKCDSWELFPTSQKWFAVGETFAHLIYLEKREKIRSQVYKNKLSFSLT